MVELGAPAIRRAARRTTARPADRPPDRRPTRLTDRLTPGPGNGGHRHGAPTRRRGSRMAGVSKRPRQKRGPGLTKKSDETRRRARLRARRRLPGPHSRLGHCPDWGRRAWAHATPAGPRQPLGPRGLRVVVGGAHRLYFARRHRDTYAESPLDMPVCRSQDSNIKRSHQLCWLGKDRTIPPISVFVS